MCSVVFFVVFFFFFKQKTAYEMLISDWSSDVCSSDLRFHLRIALKALGEALQGLPGLRRTFMIAGSHGGAPLLMEALPAFHEPIREQLRIGAHARLVRHRVDHRPAPPCPPVADSPRITLDIGRAQCMGRGWQSV